jgi:pSer/pThr/pTyr-binding forkhead associated (FHA) protein
VEAPTREQPAAAPHAGPVATATAFATLVVIAKDGSEGATFQVTERTDVGRREGSVRFPDDGYLSQRHAALELRGNALVLRDLDSVNGVFLRLRGIDSAQGVPLRDQDTFLIGQQLLRLELAISPAANPVLEHDTLLFGTPSVERLGRIAVRSVDGTTHDLHYVRRKETVLGRETGDIVFPDDLFLSRRHAAIRFADATTCALVDLGSSNGTFVRIRGEVPLQNRDEFRVGQQLLRVVFAPSVGRGGV